MEILRLQLYLLDTGFALGFLFLWLHLKYIYSDPYGMLSNLKTVLLIGYMICFSMGGSVAVHVAARKVVCSVAGLVVVDVVEVRFGTLKVVN